MNQTISFISAMELLALCVKHGILEELDGRILMYRAAKGEYPEGWYADDKVELAQELMNDTEGVALLIKTLEDMGVTFEPVAYVPPSFVTTEKQVKVICVCSPLRGDVEANVAKAKEYCRDITLEGNIPIASHVYCTSFLDDSVEEERQAGMRIGTFLLRFCDELRVYGDRLSEGMRAEIIKAKEFGIPVVYMNQKHT